MAASDLGKKIDQLYKLQQRRIAQQHKVDELKREETALDAEIRAALLDDKLLGAKGRTASFTMTTETVGQVEDWGALHKWIAAHKAFDLLQRRISNATFRELLATGKAPLGVRAEKILKSSVRKAGSR